MSRSRLGEHPPSLTIAPSSSELVGQPGCALLPVGVIFSVDMPVGEDRMIPCASGEVGGRRQRVRRILSVTDPERIGDEHGSEAGGANKEVAVLTDADLGIEADTGIDDAPRHHGAGSPENPQWTPDILGRAERSARPLRGRSPFGLSAIFIDLDSAAQSQRRTVALR